MLLLSVLSIVVLISSLLCFLGYKNKLVIKATPFVIIVLIFFFFPGAALIYIQSGEISIALNRQHWPKTTGVVIKTQVVGERAYNPEITCSYIVNDIEYSLVTDLDTPGFGRKRSRQSTAHIIIDEYPVGSSVTLFYNPQNPAESYIRTGPYWYNYMQLSLGLLVFSIGISGLFSLITAKFVKKKILN
jgi:hypothetical protein